MGVSMRAIIVLSLLCLVLGGCTTFGVDNETWAQLTPQQREVAMQNYYQQQAQQQAEQAKLDRINAKKQAEIDKINAQNAPLNDAIAAVGALAGSHSSQQQQHKQCVTDNFGQTVCGYNCYVDQFGDGHCANA
jgi:cell division protein FtsB